jgi:Tfp pilus assembly protein PilN
VRATATAKSQAYAVQNDINVLLQEEQRLRQQADAVKKSLTAEQQQTLVAAHTLADRKRFSWSRLLSDLELALPGVVRVKSIAVNGVITRDNDTIAQLELTVVAKNPATVTDMIAEMDRAGIFHAEILTQNLQRGRDEGGTEYELAVVYQPRSGTPRNAVASASAAPPANDVAKGKPE